MKKFLLLLLFGGFVLADPIKVGMDYQYPPFEYLDQAGNINGFDVDLANELAKRVGFEVQIVKMNYDSICGAINDKKIDIGISAFGADEATEACDHGVSYMETEVYFVKDKSRTDINTPEDLAGKKIAHNDISVLKDMIVDLGATPVAKKTGTFISTLLLLHEAKVDTILIYSDSMPILNGFTEILSNADKNRLELISGGLSNFVVYHTQPSDDSETFVIYPKDGRLESLKTQMNSAIIQMRKDGTIKSMLGKYGIK